MFKFTIIVFVVVWLGSLIFSRRRRVIRDVNHLIQLIIAAAIFFGASTAVRGSFLHDSMLTYVPALIVTFAASWGISLLILKHMSASSTKQPRR
ncbi:MAG: hypothetical protein ACK5JO_00335 [Halodesulfovibrio sp.]